MTGLRTQIREQKDFKLINQHVRATLILHNLLKSWDDEWNAVFENEEVDEEANKAAHDVELNTTGDGLRAKVQTSLLHWYYHGVNEI